MFEDEIIKELYMKRQEDIIHSYSKLKGEDSTSTNDIVEKMHDLNEEQRKRLSKLLNAYSENKNAEGSFELEFFYEAGFKDGAKLMLETFGKENGEKNENI